jgi:hypothetical protein
MECETGKVSELSEQIDFHHKHGDRTAIFSKTAIAYHHHFYRYHNL